MSTGTEAFSGKAPVAVMTGATGGIGTCVCARLLETGYIVYAACRNAAKGEKFLREMAGRIPPLPGVPLEERLVFIPADLTSLASADRFADRILARLGPGSFIDLLVNNAGMIAPEFKVTEDGYESSLQVNYLAPCRIIGRLLPRMNPVSGRIVNTLSCTIRAAAVDEGTREWLHAGDTAAAAENLRLQGSRLERERKHFRSLKNYGNSKWLLAVFTVRLHRRLQAGGSGIRAVGADPGVVNTNIITQHRWYDPLADLFFRPFIKTPRQGALPLIRAAETPGSALSPEPVIFKGKKTVPFPGKIIGSASCS